MHQIRLRQPKPGSGIQHFEMKRTLQEVPDARAVAILGPAHVPCSLRSGLGPSRQLVYLLQDVVADGLQVSQLKARPDGLKPWWSASANPPHGNWRCQRARAAVACFTRAMGATIAWDDFAKLDVRVGRIVDVRDFPEARQPAWRLRIDFGPELGVKTSSAQITNYHREELLDRLVLAVVNFPPRQIGPFRSEVLTLGTYRESAVLLVSPEPGAHPGDRLG